MEIPLSVIKRYPKHTSGDTAICEGEQVQLRAYGGTSYLWLNPNNLSDIHSDRPWAKPAQTTIFPVQITQGQCFVDTLNVKVTVEITPAITLPNQYVVKSGDQVHLNPDIITGEHLSFTWAGDNSLTCYNCKTPYATPVVNTTYTVVATTPHGCAASTTTNVVLFCDRDQVFIPNTFTPNNDE
ncbi:MAG: hypothetical protein EBZ77_02080 [Chitinophagia bacterium]|nr:hypothetical protein [Chitinophagia bacterium]